jgi:acyl carrier protein
MIAQELKVRIIDALELEDVSPEDVADDDPLFGEGLGLDSIDALELVVLLEREYGVKFTDAAESRTALSSIGAMARYIEEHGKRSEG